MLVPINPAGNKPPVFFIHGANGVMPVGTTFSQICGPDQPFYAVNANGFDGSPAHETFSQMAQAYFNDIVNVAPEGPVVIAAMCGGSLVGLDIARKLLAAGRELGPVILFDPPRNPFVSAVQEAGWVGGRDAPAAPANATDPEVYRQLFTYVRGLMITYASIPYIELPFDARDPQQLDVATRTALSCTAALSRIPTPSPFFGAVELIINGSVTQFFLGQGSPWQRLLPNPHPVHVYPCGHIELFRTYRFTSGRLLKIILEGAFSREPAEAGAI